MTYQQQNRILAIDTNLGADRAVLTELEGEDALSRPFEMRVRFATEEPPSAVQALLGSKVTLWFGRPGESEGGPTGMERRPLHGHLRRLTRGLESRGRATEWRGEVVPALWFLSRTTDCRIFQDRSVPQIVEEILNIHGVVDFKFKLTATYKPLTYCVQYRESALDFISRLMEQVGIFYWHEHTAGRHTLVMADTNISAPPVAWPALPVTGRSDTAAIHRLDEEVVIRSGKWALRDFNFETPSLTLDAEQPTTIRYEQMQSRERFDYPGLYADGMAGRDVAKIEIEREEAHHLRRHGASGVAGLDAGLRFKIADIEEPEVLVTEIIHQAQDYSHWTDADWGRREARPPSYDNAFVCIPRRVPFRPERRTGKPFVQGPQTAIVTGPSGEEIHTDDYGRIKVQFHWDRQGRKNETSSCWIRVSQGWAGKGYGQMHIPRIGQEVVVDFLEGDPDRPIVTGRVYNAASTVPYALPSNKTQSGIKTNSSPGGGGSNEMRYEDKKGAEQIYVHAQKDLDTEVENNETRLVGLSGTGNRTTTITNDETITVGGNRTETVAKNETITIGQNRTEQVGINESVTIGSMRSHVIGAADSLAVGAARSVVVGAADSTAVGGSQSLEVGNSQTVGIGKNQSVSVGDNQTVTVGKDGSLKVGKSFILDAGDQIVFKTGSAQIIMKKNGDITIKGKNITIQGSGKINAKASSNIIMKGQKILQN